MGEFNFNSFINDMNSRIDRMTTKGRYEGIDFVTGSELNKRNAYKQAERDRQSSHKNAMELAAAQNEGTLANTKYRTDSMAETSKSQGGTAHDQWLKTYESDQKKNYFDRVSALQKGQVDDDGLPIPGTKKSHIEALEHMKNMDRFYQESMQQKSSMPSSSNPMQNAAMGQGRTPGEANVTRADGTVQTFGDKGQLVGSKTPMAEAAMAQPEQANVTSRFNSTSGQYLPQPKKWSDPLEDVAKATMKNFGVPSGRWVDRLLKKSQNKSMFD